MPRREDAPAVTDDDGNDPGDTDGESEARPGGGSVTWSPRTPVDRGLVLSIDRCIGIE